MKRDTNFEFPTNKGMEYEPMLGAVLHLTLVRKWFDKHLADKNEEYREITPYWCNKLLTWDGEVKPQKFWANRMDDFYDKNAIEAIEHYTMENRIEKRKYSKITFSNGMKPIEILPRFDRSFTRLRIGTGNREWGGTDEQVFILKCGKVRNRVNCA